MILTHFFISIKKQPGTKKLKKLKLASVSFLLLKITNNIK